MKGLFLAVLFLVSFNALADENIDALYDAKIREYNTAIANSNYHEAKEIALSLLEIDPGSTISALRFAIAIKLSGEKDDELFEEISYSIGHATPEEKQLVELSKALVK
jgi:hypothetical protein